MLRSTAIFAGDELETSSHSAFVLHGNSFSVQAGPETRSVFRDTFLLLKVGEVKAAGMIEIRAGLNSFVGDSSESRFAVSRSNHAIRVSVAAGTLAVRIGGEQLLMRAGETREIGDIEDSIPAGKTVHVKAVAGILAGAGGSISGMIASQLVKDRRDCISNCWSSGR